MLWYIANVTKNLPNTAMFHWLGFATEKFAVDGVKIFLGQEAESKLYHQFSIGLFRNGERA